MEITARKRSSDPAQEALREKKDIWNKSTTNLISRLISFKKGLNGRGDQRAGLPPSKIQEPLPTEIGSYLNHLADEALSVVKGAEEIIREQKEYSENRQKPQSVPMHAEDGLIDGTKTLISEASWWGSRFYAGLPFPFGIKGENRKYLKRMLDNAIDLNKHLKKIDNLLTSSDPNAIYHAFYETNQMLAGSYFNILQNFSKLKVDVRELAPPQEREVPQLPQEILDVPEEKLEKPPIKEKIKLKESLPLNWRDNLISINADKVFAEFIFLKLKKEKLSDKDFNNKAKQLIFYFDKIRTLLKNEIIPEDKIEEVANEYNKIVEYYDELLIDSAELLGVAFHKGLKFFDLINILKTKVSQAGVGSYLKRKWLEHKPSFLKTPDIDNAKLFAIENILDLLKLNNNFMDSIENNSSVGTIFSEFSNIKRGLVNLVENMLRLADLQNNLSRSIKNKDIFQIQRVDLTKMKSYLLTLAE